MSSPYSSSLLPPSVCSLSSLRFDATKGRRARRAPPLLSRQERHRRPCLLEAHRRPYRHVTSHLGRLQGNLSPPSPLCPQGQHHRQCTCIELFPPRLRTTFPAPYSDPRICPPLFHRPARCTVRYSLGRYNPTVGARKCDSLSAFIRAFVDSLTHTQHSLKHALNHALNHARSIHHRLVWSTPPTLPTPHRPRRKESAAPPVPARKASAAPALPPRRASAIGGSGGSTPAPPPKRQTLPGGGGGGGGASSCVRSAGLRGVIEYLQGNALEVDNVRLIRDCCARPLM
jgi:hypothetical protein